MKTKINLFVIAAIMLCSFHSCFAKGIEIAAQNYSEQNAVQMVIQGDTSLKKTESAYYYTCSMHPEIHLDQPGNCPKCGMELEKVQEGKTKKKE